VLKEKQEKQENTENQKEKIENQKREKLTNVYSNKTHTHIRIKYLKKQYKENASSNIFEK
jgi:hypothetical protein